MLKISPVKTPKSRRKIRQLKHGILVLGLSHLLIACGGDSDGGDNSDNANSDNIEMNSPISDPEDGMLVDTRPIVDVEEVILDECTRPPRIETPIETLEAGLQCSDNYLTSDRRTILLLPGTIADPNVNFDWNYVQAFDSLDMPYCRVTLPNNALADIQESAEYLAHAIRTVSEDTDKKVDIMGHSQGGMMPRWVLKFFPDTREHVENLVAFAPSNHGTSLAAFCELGICQPALLQQRDNSQFMAALNAGVETYPEIDYTTIYTRLDEVVIPSFGDNPSPALAGGDNVSNIAIQDACPLALSEHFAIGTIDPVAYELAMYAFNNDGVARLENLEGYAGSTGTASVCTQLVHPGVADGLVEDVLNAPSYVLDIALGLLLSGRQPEEPALRCYAESELP